MALRIVRRHLLLIVLLVPFFLISCNVIPRDNDGTLDRVRGGEMRVGATHYPPWVSLDGDRVGGIEPELIHAWAKQLGARVRWRTGTEAELVDALHRGELDVIAAGLRSSTPYQRRIALTLPYAELTNQHGDTEKHVLAVLPGESAFLLSLDRFLTSQETTARLHSFQQRWATDKEQP